MLDDTSPAALAYLDQRYRALTPEQRVARVLGLTEVTHDLALAELRRRDPDADDATLRLRLAERIWPPELFARFYAHRTSVTPR